MTTFATSPTPRMATYAATATTTEPMTTRAFFNQKLCAAVATALFALLISFTCVFADNAFAADNDNNVVDPTQRADNSFIYDTTIESLFEQSSLYDDRTVQIVGEVVGDRIEVNDGSHNCWITLTSMDQYNSSSISVLLSAEQANQIDHYGRYGVTGTTLQVRGIYHQACEVHDGLPDVHATNSSVLAKGAEHPDHFEFNDFLPGLAAVLIGLSLLLAFYVARERMR